MSVQRLTSLLSCIFSVFMTVALLQPHAANAEFSLNTSSQTATRFVPVTEAFPFSFFQQGEQLHLDWQVKPGYYLYRDKFAVTASNDTMLGEISIPEGTPYSDEFFGDVEIFTDPVTLTATIKQSTANSSVTVHYQGCAEAGFCYPPESITVPLQAVSLTEEANNSPSHLTPEQQAPTQSRSASEDIADSLSQNWWQPLIFFALGIGLAFTPCVLPMYPILTGIVLGGKSLSQGQVFKLSMIYVQGMALTYTLLGLVVASAGLQFQAAFQHPYVLIGLSALFILLALSMFGAFTLSLPAALQSYLSNISNDQKGGTVTGVFAMGAISGLICSPCTTAPLSGALLYVAQTGDLLTGAITLYALALGMGVPLILVAMFGKRLLPASGEWMNKVKVFFGFVLLAVPLFLLERILPDAWANYLWLGLAAGFFAWLYTLSRSTQKAWLSTAFVLIAFAGIGATSAALYSQLSQPQAQKHSVSFVKVASLEELQQTLEMAKQDNKAAMLDFYADWCVACKEFEKYTFNDNSVSPLLQDMVLIQADVTKNRPEDFDLLREMNVLGLPTLDFWAADGQYIPAARLTGFVNAEPFVEHLEKHGLVAR